MNANEIAFGIEFETTLPDSDTTPIGPYHGGYQVPWLPDGLEGRTRQQHSNASCRAARDANLSARNFADTKGCNRSKQRSTRSTLAGAKVNATCGLHITIEWNGDAAALARLISLVGNHERAIFASTGTRRREQTIYTQEDQTIREQRPRQTTLRSGSLPPAEPDAPGPRTEPHRIPGLRRHAQQDQGRSAT